jgi:Ca2+-binding EF-hand superfamily protein
METSYPDVFLFDTTKLNTALAEFNFNIDKRISILQNEENMVDIMEVYAVLFTFCKAQFDDKIKASFMLFDYDGSGQIEFPEMCSTLQSYIMGLCKITGTPLPKESEIQHLAVKAFTYLDPDGSGTIDFHEFEDWVTIEEDIQYILFAYLNYLTINKALDMHVKYYTVCVIVGSNDYIRNKCGSGQ